MSKLEKEALGKIEVFIKKAKQSKNFRNESKAFAQGLYLELTKKPKNSLLSLEIDGYPLLSSYEHLKELSGKLDEVVELMVSGACSSPVEIEVILSKKEELPTPKDPKTPREEKKSQPKLTNIPKPGTKEFIVHVPTKGAWIQVVKALLGVGYKWHGDHSDSESVNESWWDNEESNSCIDIDLKLSFSPKKFYEKKYPNIPLLSAQLFFNKYDTQEPRQELVFPKPGTKEFVIPVPTKEDWIRVVEVLIYTGYRWGDDNKSLNEEQWDHYKEGSSIFIGLERLEYSPTEFYRSNSPSIPIESISDYCTINTNTEFGSNGQTEEDSPSKEDLLEKIESLQKKLARTGRKLTQANEELKELRKKKDKSYCRGNELYDDNDSTPICII